MDEIEAIRKELDIIEREFTRILDRLEDQSYTIRELAKFLAETGVNVSRFSPRTTQTLIAVALNGDY
jgi:hypothetical protein